MTPEYLMTIGATLKELINSDATKYAIQTVQTTKAKKNDKETINTYEDVFNKLIQENQDLKGIALAYKDEYENINIKNEDIEYLQKTAERIIKMFFPVISEKEEQQVLAQEGLTDEQILQYKNIIQQKKEQQDNFMMLIDFIQVDTLRTMQLLGFNYKKAIGEPLTKLCADAISNMVSEKRLED